MSTNFIMPIQPSLHPDIYSNSLWFAMVCLLSVTIHVYLPLLILSYYAGKIVCQLYFHLHATHTVSPKSLPGVI